MIGAEKASSGGYALPYLLSAELQLFVRLRGEAGVTQSSIPFVIFQ